MTERISKAQFEAAVGSVFRSNEDAGLEFMLMRVEEGRSTDRIEQFSLIFRGPSQPILTQGIRRLAHECLGEIDLFLVPVASTPEGADYEAAFTRFLEKK